MSTKRTNKKDALLAATVRLVANGGPAAATVRSIAREAGVTDAAVYRHYRSKNDLCCRAYAHIVEEMIRGKRHVVASDAPLREKLHQWVRLTYNYFDRHPAAFTFVLMTPQLAAHAGRSAGSGVVDRLRLSADQGDLFLEMIEEALQAGEVRPMAPKLALSHFAGVLLSVPRLIREGMLSGPASVYADEVSDAVWRILRPEAV